MDRYIQQLVEDLREAAGKVPEPGPMWDNVDMNNPAEVDDIAYVEQYFEGPREKLSSIVGIESVKLPPLERLTESQVAHLCSELTALLLAYHFVPDFPDGLPDNLCYKLLREHWDDEHVFVGAGESHIEFCEYVVEECPFPDEFCDCRRVNEEAEADDEMEASEPGSEDELPF